MLFAVSSTSLVLSVVLIVDAFRDVVVQNMVAGLHRQIARGNLRGEVYRFFAQIAFFYVAVSFVTSPVPSPLPVGTAERVLMFTAGSAVILLASIDAYLTKRHLLRRA